MTDVIDRPSEEVYWLTTNTADPAEVGINWPQTYSPDGAAECGSWYQVDTYWSDLVAGLVSDGLLTGPEEDGGALAYGVASTAGNPGGNPWRFEYSGDCPVKPELLVTPASSVAVDCASGFTTTTAITSTVDYLLVGHEWVAQAPVVSEPVVTSVANGVGDCTLPPPSNVETPVRPTEAVAVWAPAELAYTGVGDPVGAELILPAVIAMALIGAGVAAIRKGRVQS